MSKNIRNKREQVGHVDCTFFLNLQIREPLNIQFTSLVETIDVDARRPQKDNVIET